MLASIMHVLVVHNRREEIHLTIHERVILRAYLLVCDWLDM
jgi:hypothetical protein